MNWSDFEIEYKKSGSEMAAFGFVDAEDQCDKFEHLGWWLIATQNKRHDKPPTDNWHRFVCEVHAKLLQRGTQAPPQVEIEAALQQCFFDNSDFIESDSPANIGTIASDALIERRRSFASFGSEPSLPKEHFNPLDPDHPQNEARLLELLFELAGPHVGAFLHTQVPLQELFDSSDFFSQRADFLLTLPNGKGVVIEPGDHQAEQITRDQQRDRKFAAKPFELETLRPRNAEITSDKFRNQLDEALKSIGLHAFTRAENTDISSQGFLSAQLIHRIELCLLESLLCSRGWNHEHVEVHIIERDIPVAGIALSSLLLQQNKLHELYGRDFSPPSIRLNIYNKGKRSHVEDIETGLLEAWPVDIHTYETPPSSISSDLVIDASITAGSLLEPHTGAIHGPFVIIRNAPPHLRQPLFPSTSNPELCNLGSELESSLEPFLRDIFRKRHFRDGQVPILRAILGNSDTIGLLPTGAGKSICYQLTGLLRPGTTLIISPIIALMDDQVEALHTRHRVRATKAIHSGGGPMNAAELLRALEGSCFVYVAPERLQRQAFRDALAASTIEHAQRISLAVIDEAHCVSMWGHDFRPSYLRLPDNLRYYCKSITNKPPPILSLTGTASQLVLIDLMRILRIENADQVIRPDTFTRKELSYRVVRCAKGAKNEVLKEQVFKSIREELQVESLIKESYGIIFDYVPNKLWKLLGDISPNFQKALSEYPSNDKWRSIPVGFYTGGCPLKARDGQPITSLQRNWNSYKREAFKRFARGKTNCLFGNSAVSVGIDNPLLRYIVNMSMPQSLEDYYQQAGRAGRSGNDSYCYLLFSEDEPQKNDDWFLGKGDPEKHSDIDNSSYFHSQNFPGKAIDQQRLNTVLRTLNRLHNAEKCRTIRYDTLKLHDIGDDPKLTADASQRFIGYLILLGVVRDYTLEGMENNTVVIAELEPDYTSHIEIKDHKSAKDHIVKHLLAYYNRYQPKREDDLREEIEELRGEGKLLEAACNHLINFLYDKIEYQRRTAIRDIAGYCREAAGDEEKAAAIIRDYFDRSKFSNELDAMREDEPDYSRVVRMLGDLQEHSQAEQLFWETSRLLSEVERPDWLLARCCARTFLGRQDNAIVNEITQGVIQHGSEFLAGACNAFERLESIARMRIWRNVLEAVIMNCYDDIDKRRMTLKYIGSDEVPDTYKDFFVALITKHQLQRLNEHFHKRAS